MPTPLEAEINNLLRTEGDVTLVAQRLLDRWQRNLLTEQEQTDCAQFLVAAGLYPVVFSESKRLMELGTKVPWAQFAEAIVATGLPIDELEAQAMIDAADSQSAIPELMRSRGLDALHPMFVEKRAELHVQKTTEIAERKAALKDKIAFMRSHRMFEQELQVIDEFQLLFPEESDIAAERESFKQRWAREIVANSTTVTDPTADLQWKVDQLSQEQMTAKQLIVARAQEIARSQPERAYDLAVSLQLMEFHAEALDVLAFAEPSHAADWLRLELMIRSRQFVNALDQAARLELAYAGEPDSAFAVIYARARALHGLGQSGAAIELMQSLVRVRPHYRSAQSLLHDWSGGEA